MRGLSKDNAERVGLHLVMAGRLLDVDPETAYLHAQAAVRRAGRIDVVREAAGLTAYHTGRFAEALRELRTVRRLNGSSEHLPLMADAERGLGRPERAIALAATPEAETLDPSGRTELAIVVSGARSDLGEHDAALAVLDKIPADEATGDLGLRVLQARSVALEAAGRTDEAAAVLAGVDPEALARATGAEAPEEDVVVYDMYDEEADLEDGAREDATPGRVAGEDTADAGVLDEDAAREAAPHEAAPHEDRTREYASAEGADVAGAPGAVEDLADLPEPSDAEVEAEVAEILAEAGVDEPEGAETETAGVDEPVTDEPVTDEPGTAVTDEPVTGETGRSGTAVTDEPEAVEGDPEPGDRAEAGDIATTTGEAGTTQGPAA
ncbi:hypothetical protein [Myceligenerans indicum]|uniref:Replicase polyprotein 1ab n=1 Tax=Myceligenerans indicum TaxID=2593663 RepID=A0ABS1LGG2_9MICO|nr:hypothetical protein [Myceligenerans indicum]MBL0885312.1 hypothetical protein [Myceligenerans indicum]